MTSLSRQKPDPVPAIHPVPEYLAEGRTKDWYEDTKRVLQVPWMGVVTMAFAHYPNFYGVLWNGVRDLCASRVFVDACRGNRAFIDKTVVSLEPPPLLERLDGMGYAPREIGQIRDTIEVFSHGNQGYILLATIARQLLEGGDLEGSGDPVDAPRYEGRHAPDTDVPLVLMEAHHADPPTRETYEDIKQILHLPFINTDYRALARWPSYWAAAWGRLRRVAGSGEHEDICRAFHDRCVEQAAQTLPNPGGLSSSALISAAQKDAPLAEILDVCRLFQWLLPGLITNVAYLRAQLASR